MKNRAQTIQKGHQLYGWREGRLQNEILPDLIKNGAYFGEKKHKKAMPPKIHGWESLFICVYLVTSSGGKIQCNMFV